MREVLRLEYLTYSLFVLYARSVCCLLTMDGRLDGTVVDGARLNGLQHPVVIEREREREREK